MTELDYLKGFPVDRFANEAVKIREDGRASWAAFSFDLKARKYFYSVESGTPSVVRQN
jgi:hypothetical protein